jgi:hypothetical protein
MQRRFMACPLLKASHFRCASILASSRLTSESRNPWLTALLYIHPTIPPERAGQLTAPQINRQQWRRILTGAKQLIVCAGKEDHPPKDPTALQSPGRWSGY